MMILDLDTNLQPASYRYKRDMKFVHNATISPGSLSERARETTRNENETFLRSSLPNNAIEYHKNYLEYLVGAWSQHHSIVISPDIVWFAILNEIAKGVVEMPDQHRPLFTRSPDKITIAVPVGVVDEPLPVDLIVSELIGLVPIDATLFIPKFSTTTEMAQLTHLASFAETCSPYYSYMTFMCGFRRIRMDGTADDYDLAMGRAIAIYNEFDRIGSPLATWMSGNMLPWLSNIADAYHKKDAKYFENMLSVERCGSGGEIEVDGWWSKIYRQQPKGVRKPENFPTQIARVPWINIETQRRFTLNCGLFYSTKDSDDFMQPNFGWVQNEIKE